MVPRAEELERVPLLVLLPLRIGCGYALAIAGFGKVESGWLTHPHLATQLDAFQHAGRGAASLLAPLAGRVAQHLEAHTQGYSIAIALGELVIGAALCVGLLSRLSALLGFALCLLFSLVANEGLWHSPMLPLCAGLLTLSLCASGRTLGADAILRRHGSAPPWLS